MFGGIIVADEIYIVCRYTDVHLAIDGICSIIQEELHTDSRRNAIYLFCEKRDDRIKALP